MRSSFNTDFRDYYEKFRDKAPLTAKEELRLLRMIKGLTKQTEEEKEISELWDDAMVEDLWPERNWWDQILFGHSGNGKPTPIEKEQAREKFVMHNMRLVLSRVLRFRAQNDPGAMDLISHGTEGLFRAIDLFDLSRNVRFSTYAVHWIDSFIRKGMEFLEGQKPPTFKQLHRAYKKTEKLLTEELGHKPSEVYIADHLGWSQQTLSMYRTSCGANVPVETCEAEMKDENPAPESTVKREILDALRRCLPVLNDLEKHIICRHYGLDCDEETLQSLADRFGVTKERIRQIENGGLLKLYLELRRFRDRDG